MVKFGDPRVPARLWAKVFVREDGCWEWTGARWGHKKRYGAAWYRRSMWRAHRLFFTLLVRPVTPAEHTHHEECRNQLCVNPAHLRAVPQEDHWGHGHRDKTHCPHGHPYTPGNTKTTPFLRRDGSVGRRRHCIACSRERSQRSRERQFA